MESLFFFPLTRFVLSPPRDVDLVGGGGVSFFFSPLGFLPLLFSFFWGGVSFFFFFFSFRVGGGGSFFFPFPPLFLFCFFIWGGGCFSSVGGVLFLPPLLPLVFGGLFLFFFFFLFVLGGGFLERKRFSGLGDFFFPPYASETRTRKLSWTRRALFLSESTLFVE